MRPIANFTFHAILAAALAALAATSAAARQSDAFLELGGIKSEAAAPEPGGGPIALRSYSFGPSRAVATVADAIKFLNESRQSSGASAGREKMQPGGGSARGASAERMFAKSWSAGSDASGSSADPTMAQLAANRVSEAGTAYDAGSVTLTGNFPSCRIGTAYDDAAIGQAGERYEMQRVTVAVCAPDSMSLNFKKVTVRGWNPEKKEE